MKKEIKSVPVTQKFIEEKNTAAIHRLLIRQQNTEQYDAAINRIYEAKDMLNRISILHPKSKAKVTIEIEPVRLHVLEDLMHDLGGKCRNFTGTLNFENGTVIIKTV